MIGYFPRIYPDELVYSCLARYAAHTGYLVYRTAAEDLFQNRLDRPSVEFLNKLSDNAYSALTSKMRIEELIHKHTMFDYYARFAPTEKRIELLNMLVSGDAKGFNNGISTRKLGQRFLRYCPICAQEDRKRYGECYWHRMHQIPEIDVCVYHGCYLHTSTVSVNSTSSPAFYSAESTVSCEPEPSLCNNTLLLDLTQYISTVFQSSYDMKSDVVAGAFLRSQLEGTKYCSPRGEVRYLTALHSDIMQQYKNIALHGFTESWQLSKLLTGYRHNLFEICVVAHFIGIDANALSDMILPLETQFERFDRLTYELRAQGLKSPEIGRRLGASYHVVKEVWRGAYHHKPDVSDKHQRTRGPKIDWEALDNDIAPKVVEVIKALQDFTGETCPEPISPGKISRVLGLKEGQIAHLKRTQAIIREHTEPSDVHAARRLIWAYRRLKQEGVTITQTSLQSRLNTKKTRIVEALLHIEKFASPETVSEILQILNPAEEQ